jgi:uncharacterized protein (TIGR03435 family)
MRKWQVAVLTLAAAGFGRAQTPDKPAWDVVSVKLNETCGGRGRGMSGPPAPGRLNMQCNTVENLIQMAYVFFQNGASPTFRRIPINGGPSWIRSEQYAINAKAEGAAPVAQMLGPMLQALLEERFKLKIHHEAKEGSVYVMTVAKGGSKLQPTKEGGCIPLDMNHLPPVTPGQPVPNICGSQQMRNMGGKTMSVKGIGLSIADWANGMLSDLTGRPVIDKTGLTGKFDIEMEIAPDSSMPMFQGMAGRGGRGDAAGDAGGVPSAADPEGPTIFMALEKLGLRLESAKGPVDTLVIDHVEKPTEN